MSHTRANVCAPSRLTVTILQAFYTHVQLQSAVTGTSLVDDYETMFVDSNEWLNLLKDIEVTLSTTLSTEDEELVCVFVCASVCLRLPVCYRY